MTDPDVMRRVAALEETVRRLQTRERPGSGSASVYRTTNQSIASGGAPTPLSFDAVRRNDGFWSALQPTRLTAPAAGTYEVGISLAFAANGTGVRGVALRAGGTTDGALDFRTNAGAADVTAVTFSRPFDLVAGSFFEVYVYQTSGGPLNVLSASAYSPEFWMVRLQ